MCPADRSLGRQLPPDDLAVIRADDPSGMEPARFGDIVLAAGNPFGLSGSVTGGTISATDRGSPNRAPMLGPDGAPSGAGSSRSPAESPPTRAGPRPGDGIQSAGQERTPDTQVLSRALAAAQPGDQVTLTVAPGTERLTVKVTLGELPGS